MNKYMKLILKADFLMLLSIGLFAPIYALFVRDIGGTILDAAGAWALYAFSAGLCMIFIDMWVDVKKNYTLMLFFGYLLQSISMLGYYFVENIQFLFIIQIILGISVALADPAFDKLYGKFLDKQNFGGQWDSYHSMNMIGSATAALVGGLIAQFFGFKILFLGMFTLGLIGALFSFRLVFSKLNIEENL